MSLGVLILLHQQEKAKSEEGKEGYRGGINFACLRFVGKYISMETPFLSTEKVWEVGQQDK